MAMDWDLQEAMDYYRSQGAPRDQQALVSLLKELQQQKGSIDRASVGIIAEGYALAESYLLALIRRMPSLRLARQHVLELCAGPNCGRHADLAAFAEGLTGMEVKFVPCQRQCGKGPNIRLDGKLYNRADVALLRSLLAQEE